MRILIFNWRDLKHTWAGGGEIYIFEQAKRWVQVGHDVTILCGDDIEKNLPKQETINGIKIIRKGGRYGVYFWAMWSYLKYFRGKTDIVIDVVNGIPFFTPLFCLVPKVCYVYHVHGKQFFYELTPPFNYIGFFIERFLFPLFYRHIQVIAISKTTKDELESINFKKNKISIVYSGISEIRRSKRLNKKFFQPTILYLGRIKKYKRVDLLVKIFPKVVEKIPKARLIIAGWGTEASIITDLVMKSHLRRKITLLGPVTQYEKKTLLSKSWVFVNPSIGEGWSIAVIEANHYGTPAIAFKVKGLTESIKHEKTGLLAKNENDLIEKICNVLKNKTLQKNLSRNAVNWAEDFNWERSSHESLAILKKVYNNYHTNKKFSFPLGYSHTLLRKLRRNI